MIDQNYLFNKQISEFLSEYKFRFSQINYQNMPGKIAYSTKLNRTDVNASMNM